MTMGTPLPKIEESRREEYGSLAYRRVERKNRKKAKTW